MKTDNWTLVRGARQLLTLYSRSGARHGHELSDLGVIVDGSVLSRNGVIVEVGPTRRVENMSGARHAEVIDAAGRVVMPAFIDPHTSVLPVPGYRRHTTRSVHSLPATRLEAQLDELLKLMARHGTATIGALTGSGGDATGELKILRALRSLDLKPLDIVSILFFAGNSAVSDASRELLDCVSRRKLAGIAAVHCGEAGPHQLAEALLRNACDLGMSIRLELPLEHEIDLVETAVHLSALSVTAAGPYRAPEIEALSRSSTVAIIRPHLLAQAEKSGSARELIDNGALIALGSGLNPDEPSTASMQTVIQMACEHFDMSLPEAITAATVNAAWALGIGARTGSLEHGKAADMILLNAGDYREIPLLSGTNLIHSMLKRGVVLFKEDFSGWPSRA